MKGVSITKTSKSHPNISYIYPMGLFSMFLDCILTVVSFASPYWLTSTTEIEFSNLGLWTVCIDILDVMRLISNKLFNLFKQIKGLLFTF